MTPTLNKSTLILGMLLFLMAPCQASNQDEELMSETWPLSRFMVTDEQIIIRNASGRYNLSFPISDRIEPVSAFLELNLINSNVLKGNRSQLVVYLNDFIVGQMRLSSNATITKIKLPVLREYLRNGYNQLTFKAAQHYTDNECEDWSAPELWTQIDSVNSTLTLEYRKLPVAEKLSELNRLINDRVGNYDFAILRGSDAVSDGYLYWGAVIAQGVKLRLKYVPMQIQEAYVKPHYQGLGSADDVFKIDTAGFDKDLFIVGRRNDIADLLPKRVVGSIQGPYLGLYRQHGRADRFFLVVSGLSDDEVKQAAQAFVMLDTLFPNEQETIVHRIDIPYAQSVLPKQSILSGETYQFADLNLNNAVLNIADTDAVLEFRMPPDFFSTEEAMVDIHLDLAYGAAMRKDSVINISLNGTFVHAVQFKEESGGYYRNYRIPLPLRSFSPGLNTLKFSAVLTPSEYGECTFVQKNNLLVSLLESSTLSFPVFARVATLPDLNLLKKTGYPLFDNASAINTAFRLTDTSSDSIASAWHLIARMADHYKTPVFDYKISRDDIDDRENIVIIGKITEKNTPKILEGAPISLGAHSVFPYRFKESQEIYRESAWERLTNLSFDTHPLKKSAAAEPENIVMTQSGGLGSNYLLVSYPSGRGKGVVTAFLSEGDNDLYPGVVTLAESAWNQINGNVFVWDKTGRFHWDNHGTSIVKGDGIKMRWIMHFSNHPWQWIVLIVSLLLTFAWLTYLLLGRFKQKIHA